MTAALPLTAIGDTEVYIPLGSANAIAAIDAKWSLRSGYPSRLSRGSVIDVNDRQVKKQLPTGSAPNYVVSKRDSSRFYVSNAGDDTVNEIDTAGWTVLRNLPAGKNP